jgi:hypothetical protein
MADPSNGEPTTPPGSADETVGKTRRVGSRDDLARSGVDGHLSQCHPSS